MNPFAIAFLAMLLVATIMVLGAALFALIRIRGLTRRIELLRQHPTLVSAREFEAIGAKVDALRSSIEPIKQQWELISADIAALMEASAAFRLQVGRASFATGLLLRTFVPTLRGSMSDP